MNKTSFSIINEFLYKTFLLHCSVSTYTTINHFGKIHAKTHGFSFFLQKNYEVLSIFDKQKQVKSVLSVAAWNVFEKKYILKYILYRNRNEKTSLAGGFN